MSAPDDPAAAAAQQAPTDAGRAPKPASWVYAEDFAPESAAALAARAAAADFGIAPVSRGAAALLTVLARAIGARAVVEIGSGTGVSGLALFAGMAPDGILTSVDIEGEHQARAREAFGSVGVPDRRFRLIQGEALTVLPKLSDGAYDLVLVDADKLEYAEYVAQAVRLLRPGGLLVIDNALWHDRVADPRNSEDETILIREALEAIRDGDELLASLVPVGDGLLLGVRRPGVPADR
ncbi:O-methyltransferase [Naumannella cuiyingiana]|uniref:Putative O-methyltransferase YrrM n=1 Tax=Naumannella cuiyingiana TaxID=1347891 RepID=A0A7Z0DAG4_9ACTN|nr:O-methyltransferase [Naumannella cuiyingiana]NYI71954.1 putative O-methyltransferase YrrM [Naumannella cuiyingiana]